MTQKPLTVRDALRAVSRVMTPVANVAAKALTVGEYRRGQESSEPSNANPPPRKALYSPRRPWQQWPTENAWGHDSESDHFERILWTEQTFFDADIGVTYGESTWDGPGTMTKPGGDKMAAKKKAMLPQKKAPTLMISSVENPREAEVEIRSNSPTLQKYLKEKGIKPYSQSRRESGLVCWYTVPENWVHIEPRR